MIRSWIASAVLVAMVAQPLVAEATTWNKVRYNGGPIQTKVDAKDWNNTLTITPESIELALNDGQSVHVAPQQVTGLTYGQEAHRHVALMTSLGVIVTPLALFGLFHKQRLHFIGIEYAASDTARGGLLIQGANDNYRAILFSLKSVTGKTVQTNAEDAKYVNP